MSFGFSVGDIVLTTQLSRRVFETLQATKNSPNSSLRAIEEFKRLIQSLSELIDATTSDVSKEVLTQELFQEPLRDALSQIRRDVQAFEEASQKKSSFRATGRKVAWDLSSKKDLELIIDRISVETARLQDLLALANSSKQDEILLSIRSISSVVEANSSEEGFEIRQWLAELGQQYFQNSLLSQFEKQTDSWILEDSRYHTWKDSQNSFLMLWGIPGSGKSVLSARIVESLQLDDASSHQVVFFRFNASQEPSSSLERCLMSLIGQLISKESEVPRVVRMLYSNHAGGIALPNVQLLQDIMLSVLPTQTSCYIVLDAIDECFMPEKAIDVANAIRRGGTEGLHNVHLFATSRQLFSIQTAFLGAGSGTSTIIIEVKTLGDDIKRFVEQQLDQKTGRSRISLELKEQISTTIAERSRGMFPWALLLLDEIFKALTVKAIKNILDKPLLPDLDELYSRMLRDIPPKNYGMVRRVLVWLMNSARPLTIKELSDAVVLNVADEIINPDDRPTDLNGFLKLCSPFVVQTHEVNEATGMPQTILRLVHASFSDFLRSNHPDNPLLDIRHSEGDRILADCCISYLLSSSEKSPVPDEDSAAFQLLAYAAEYWPYHARRTEDARLWHSKTTQLILRLFHEKNGASFSNWLRVFDPTAPEGTRFRIYSAQENDRECSSLFYASSLGLRQVLVSLLGAEKNKAAPELEAGLYEASYNGYADIVGLLLEQGTSPNITSWYDGRPLDAAIFKGHIPIVKLLLHYKADVTYKGGITGSPFEPAVNTGDAELVDLIVRPLKTMIPPRAFLKSLCQGLRDAARNGHLEVVQVLFNADEHGDLDATDEAGWTALHYAIRYKHDEVQQFLIDHGADIDKMNLAGETPADFAWYDRRLDLSLYNKVADLKKKAKQAFSCHVLQQVSESGECRMTIFRKSFKLKDKNRVAKPKARTAIIREHTLLQRINHPFIVGYLWYEEDKVQETAQLYLEYCNGGDLDAYNTRAIASGEDESSSDENDQIVSSGPFLMPNELWRYMFQVAAALAYLHYGLSLRSDRVFTFERHWNQIKHRDIKPSNIVLNIPSYGPAHAKLCDLGLAKGLSPKLKEAKETGGIGTRNYWPPEMFQRSGFWTAKGDIYSYGSTFDDLWTKSARLNRNCQPPKEILGKCMSIEPAERPSSIELLEIMRKYVMEELPLCTSSLHELLGQSHAGYLHDALYQIAGQLDTKEAYESRSVKVRRETLIKRLKLLCDDGAGVIFDTQPGSLSMRLHVAILLNREIAFNQTLETTPQAINSRWSDSGWTPLHLAAQERNIKMYNQLLKANADEMVRDKSEHIASHYLPTS